MHPAGLGELDRVRQKVVQNLKDAVRIAHANPLGARPGLHGK